MKKYLPIDFDEKGKPILGAAKDSPTAAAFIPTLWEPGNDDGGGGGEQVKGILSITVDDPSFSFVDLKMPLLWDDLIAQGAEVKDNGITVVAVVDGLQYGKTYNVTTTPTQDWAASSFSGSTGEAGKTATYTRQFPTDYNPIAVCGDPDGDNYIMVQVVKNK